MYTAPTVYSTVTGTTKNLTILMHTLNGYCNCIYFLQLDRHHAQAVALLGQLLPNLGAEKQIRQIALFNSAWHKEMNA